MWLCCRKTASTAPIEFEGGLNTRLNPSSHTVIQVNGIGNQAINSSQNRVKDNIDALNRDSASNELDASRLRTNSRENEEYLKSEAQQNEDHSSSVIEVKESNQDLAQANDQSKKLAKNQSDATANANLAIIEGKDLQIELVRVTHELAANKEALKKALQPYKLSNRQWSVFMGGTLVGGTGGIGYSAYRGETGVLELTHWGSLAALIALFIVFLIASCCSCCKQSKKLGN